MYYATTLVNQKYHQPTKSVQDHFSHYNSCCHCTHPRVFSNRLAGEPTISPRVQNICPRKSWRSSGREGGETGEQGGGDVHTVDEIQGLKRFPIAPTALYSNYSKIQKGFRRTLNSEGFQEEVQAAMLTIEHSM